MSGIFPHSVGACDYKVGQQVKWYVNEQAKSPYIGVVTEIAPGANKVYVEWPVGGNQQMDPTELLIITPESDGISPIKSETGYSSYEKEKSKKQFGMISPKVLKLAEKLAASSQSLDPDEYSVRKMASNIAGKFASGVVERIASDILNCKKEGMSDAEAYQTVYPGYENICSDYFMRFAVSKIYKGE
jgi:hypothetical protein